MISKDKRKELDELYRECYNLYIGGMYAEDIAKKVGKKLSTLLEALRKIDPDYAEKSPKIQEINKRKLKVKILVDEGKTSLEIAKILKTKRSLIESDLRDLNIRANQRKSGLFGDNLKKQCTRCLDIKPIKEFYKEKRSADGHTSCCQICHLDSKHKKLLIPEYKRKHLEWRKTNARLRYKNDINYKVDKILRQRIGKKLMRNKRNKSLELLGCDIFYARKHLESKFLPGMTWENYGLWKRGEQMKWHVDHIIPCAKFDLTDPEQQKLCFHYTNLQPLWAIDNLRKNKF